MTDKLSSGPKSDIFGKCQSEIRVVAEVEFRNTHQGNFVVLE